jgi:hypothetical protein
VSNKRYPGRIPWTPADIPAITNPSTRPRNHSHGWEASVQASIAALERAGASDVVCGYTAPDYDGNPDEAPAGTPMLWWFEATYSDSCRVRGEATPTADHGRGILEAAAVILRGTGRRVTIVRIEAA